MDVLAVIAGVAVLLTVRYNHYMTWKIWNDLRGNDNADSISKR